VEGGKLVRPTAPRKEKGRESGSHQRAISAERNNSTEGVRKSISTVGRKSLQNISKKKKGAKEAS